MGAKERNPDYAKVTEGQILMLSTGEYSDYCVRALYRVRQGFDMAAEIEAFKETAPKDEWTDLKLSFLTHLERSGYVEDVEHRELHIGSYNTLEIE